MDTRALLRDVFGRVAEHVDEILDGLDPDLLNLQPALGTNPIGWLVWHISRVEDAQVADLAGRPQVWEHGPYAGDVGLAPDPGNSGYGHTRADVAAVRPRSTAALREYFEAVRARTHEVLDGLTDADLDRVIDRNWDPPVTVGVRLISIADDQIQHAGAAAYLKGLLSERQ